MQKYYSMWPKWMQRAYKNPYGVNVDRLPEMGYHDIYYIDSGVYFIYTADYKEILYVGQSKNVKNRIQHHMRNLDDVGFYTGKREYSEAVYKAIPVDEKDLLAVEAFFINKLKPPMNYDGNPRENRKSYQRWIGEQILEYDRTHNKELKECD